MLRGSNGTYDALPTHYPFSDHAFTKLRSVYRQRISKELDASDFQSFTLVDEQGMLTIAGALLADESPLRCSRIFCTRWYGLDKASGVMEAMDDEEVSGSLITLLQSGEEFVRNNTKKRWKKTGTGRLEMPEYPQRAVLECIVNALIHRDYLDLGSEVHIDIFDDRLEVYSPGGMKDGSLVQVLDIERIPSKRRNPIIADIFSRMNYMERRGSGFKKIREDYHNAVNFRPELEPKFYSDPFSFWVTLYNLNYRVPIEKTDVLEEKQLFSEEKTDVVEGNRMLEVLVSNLTGSKPTRENALEMYRRFGSHTAFARADIMETVGITSTPAGELIRKLKSAGLIEPVRGEGKGKYRFIQK